ncbi:hypothetical protein [Acinetobacter gyllenbergii]|uniref:hypothetical protein n=1 Tax=Acinetobacter gyllenbergii TaxID=134534 RepID=UPI003F55284D
MQLDKNGGSATELRKTLAKMLRDFHALKEPGAPDRTLDQLKSDAEELYEKHGKPIPEWLKR